MLKKWMLNAIAALGSLWLVYVFLHWTQLRVWTRLHQPITLKFNYVVTTSSQDESKFSNASNRSETIITSYNSIVPLTLKPYKENIPVCRPKNLGKVDTPFRIEDLTKVMKSRSTPLHRGIWQPAECKPANRIAVLIPYRNRPDNLELVTHHLNFFLQQQEAQYGLFVIEQNDTRLFNRAKLFNVGVRILTKMYPEIDCYVFHDADKLPMNTHHIYSCLKQPRHMISLMRTSKSEKFNRGNEDFGKLKEDLDGYKLYNFFFGGVTAMTRAVYEKVNGMSNKYWGWGREDDDMCARLRLRGFMPQYTMSRDAKFVNIVHKHDIIINKNPWPHFSFVRHSMMRDGLSDLKFSIVSITHNPLYTLFKVKL